MATNNNKLHNFYHTGTKILLKKTKAVTQQCRGG